MRLIGKEKSSMILYIKSLFLLLSTCGVTLCQSQLDTVMVENDNYEKFAYYLADLGLYEMAAEELEKAIFYEGESVEKLNNLFNYYSKSGQSQKMVSRMKTVINKEKNIVSLYMQSLIRSGRSHEARIGLRTFDKYIDSGQRARYQYEISLLDRDWREAKKQFSQLPTIYRAHYRDFNNEIPPKNRKSPTAAMVMSSIVPSSGRFYVGDYKDALFSLTFMAGPAYQSYRRFSKGGIESTGGWIYGGVAFGFYLGNIYGSGQSAKIYNLKKDEAVLRKARSTITSSYE